jgi:hypothetical protein
VRQHRQGRIRHEANKLTETSETQNLKTPKPNAKHWFAAPTLPARFGHLAEKRHEIDLIFFLKNMLY